MLKKELIIALISFVLVGGIVFFVVSQANKQNPDTSGMSPKTAQEKAEEQALEDSQTMMQTEILTEEVVGRHNRPDDCWFIVDGLVYDVTDFNQHPGGRDRIEAFCGKDASDAFATKGDKGEPHSEKAKGFLKDFYYGQLGDEIEK